MLFIYAEDTTEKHKNKLRLNEAEDPFQLFTFLWKRNHINEKKYSSVLRENEFTTVIVESKSYKRVRKIIISSAKTNETAIFFHKEWKYRLIQIWSLSKIYFLP